MTDNDAHEAIASATAETSSVHVAVVQMVARLFDHWRLSSADRTALLGDPVEPVGQFSGYESVANNESAERMGHLIAVHSALRSSFAQNRDLAYA